MHHRLLRVLPLIALAGAIACGSDSTAPANTTDQGAALSAAESRWTAAGIHDYNYDYVRDQFGVHDSVLVQVRADQVTLSKSYVSGQATTIGQAIPDVFNAVDDAINAGLNVSVTYDTQLGYPARGSLNPPNPTPAGGVSWQIVNFARVP